MFIHFFLNHFLFLLPFIAKSPPLRNEIKIMDLNEEQTAMAKVLKAMRVPPRQVRELLYGKLPNSNRDFESISEFTSCLEEEVYGNFTMDMEERAFDTLAQVVTYMNIKGFPTFVSVLDDADAFLAMQQHLGSLLTVDESLAHFYQEAIINGKSGYMLYVQHGVVDYASLHQHMGQLRTAGLSGVDASSQILMWRLLSSMTPPDSLELLEDPLGDFNMMKALHTEMDAFLAKFGIFTDSDMEHISHELTYCSYKNLVKYDNDFRLGAGDLRHIPADRRNLLRRVVDFMNHSMKQVTVELRMLEFDLDEFNVHESLHLEMKTFLARLGFSQFDTEWVRESLHCCSYNNLVNEQAQIWVGTYKLRNISAERRHILFSAIRFMETSMRQVPAELRIRQFDFATFRAEYANDDSVPVSIELI